MKAQKAIACVLSGLLAAVSLRGIARLPVGAEEADLAAVSISTVTVEEDGSFVTTVNLDVVPKTGLCAVDFAVAYDPAVLNINGIKLLYDTGAEDAETAVSPDFKDTVFTYEDTGSEIRLRWATALKNAEYWLRETRPFVELRGTMYTDTSGNKAELELIPATRETFEGSGVQNTTIVMGYVDSEGKTYNCETELTNGLIWRPDENGVTMYGDMNLNGMIEISDAILLHRLVNEETITLGAAAYANADCEQDGRLTVADVTLILRKLEEESEGAASGTD